MSAVGKLLEARLSRLACQDLDSFSTFAPPKKSVLILLSSMRFAFLYPDHKLIGAITLSASMSSLSLVSLRSLRYMPLSRQCLRQVPVVRRRSLHTSPKSFSSDEKSFRGQLYESTARRIQAQREAEARFASMTPMSSFAQNSAFTFGMHTPAAGTFRS